MRKFQFAPWALAAVLAVAAPGIPAVWALSSAGTVSALKSELPAGVTLSSATIPETARALGAAVAAHPESAASLTEVAILAKTPKKGHGTLSCRNLTKIVGASVNAAPQKSSDIVQMALSMYPQCADALNALLSGPESSGLPAAKGEATARMVSTPRKTNTSASAWASAPASPAVPVSPAARLAVPSRSRRKRSPTSSTTNRQRPNFFTTALAMIG